MSKILGEKNIYKAGSLEREDLYLKDLDCIVLVEGDAEKVFMKIKDYFISKNASKKEGQLSRRNSRDVS